MSEAAVKAMSLSQEGFALTDEQIQKMKAPINRNLVKYNEYDKFGDGSYISVETITDILNDIFGYRWSWEIINFYDKGDYVVCHGRLTIPGIGIRDGIGQAKADKKDNSTTYSAAASYAFKSAVKRLGIAQNIFNPEGYNVPLFEGMVVPPKSNKPQVKSVKKVPQTAAEKGAELKEAYGIQTKAQFVAFAQIWNPTITDFSQITPEVIEELHAYVEAHPEEFEDFVASNY